MKRISQALLIMIFPALAACTVSERSDATADSAVTVDTTTMMPPMMIDSAAMIDPNSRAANMRIEVDLGARKLYVLDGADSSATYDVAVGSQEWPTQTGQWRISQVVWNPEWIPPDESWAEQNKPRQPGDPQNPLGRAQLVYDPPRSIHGTNEPSSIGKAVSHGSIRLSNDNVTKLGRELMEATGVGRDSAFYRNVATNRKEKVIVDLPGGVPIRVF
jgi:lipoprotein-anchoring transpeptidase ErfK/SrfK